MQIGQLSKKTGVSVRMLRYYEREGLLRPGRTPAGYRTFVEEDLATVRRIVLFNGAGLKLATVRGLLACSLPGQDGLEPCQALKDSVRQRLKELDSQISELSESRKLLASIVTPPVQPDTRQGSR